jgi:hypothetical protein
MSRFPAVSRMSRCMKTPKDQIVLGIFLIFVTSPLRALLGDGFVFLGLLGVAIFCFGLGGVAKTKGHSRLWGLTGLVMLVGGIVVKFLPQRTSESTAVAPASSTTDSAESPARSLFRRACEFAVTAFSSILMLCAVGLGLAKLFGSSSPELEVRYMQNFFGTVITITSADDEPFTVTKIVVNGTATAPDSVNIPLMGNKNQKDIEFGTKGRTYSYDVPDVEGRVIDATIHTNRGKHTYKF